MLFSCSAGSYLSATCRRNSCHNGRSVTSSHSIYAESRSLGDALNLTPTLQYQPPALFLPTFLSSPISPVWPSIDPSRRKSPRHGYPAPDCPSICSYVLSSSPKIPHTDTPPDTAGPTSLTYTPDGKYLITVGSNELIRKFTVASEDEPITIDHAQDCKTGVTASVPLPVPPSLPP